MEENRNKELDAFIKKAIKEVGPEEPSVDFTPAVLFRITLLEEKKAIVYRPLISKSGWLVIGLIFLGITSYLFFGNITLQENWVHFSKLNTLTEFNLFGKIPKVNVSDTYVYGCMGLAFFVWIQVYLLKRYLIKQYN